MHARLSALVLFVLVAAAACAQPASVAIQGNWEGQFISGPMQGTPVRAELIGQSHGYKANVYIGEGAGQPVARFIDGSGGAKKVVFAGDADLGANGGIVKLGMTMTKGQIKGQLGPKKSGSAFTLTRVEKKSPTLGEQPPAGAVVLFDGKTLDAWQPTEIPWTITPEGAMEVGKGSIRSKEEFGDAQYHIEFRTPYMPDKKGQARGNSGVYIMGRYEVQVLDSFGLIIRDNECGGIYKLATPAVNACLPPTEWQTYDITFKAPKFDAAGKKTQTAFITVKQNGITIHDNVELPTMTPGGISDQEAPKGPLLLQDHNNKVQYRNIWVKPL